MTDEFRIYDAEGNWITETDDENRAERLRDDMDEQNPSAAPHRIGETDA